MQAKIKSWAWTLLALALLYAAVQNPTQAASIVRGGFDIVGDLFTGATSFGTAVLGG